VLEERLQRIFAVERHRMDQYGHMLAWCRNWASALSAEALQRGLVPDRVRRFIADFRLAPPSRHMEHWPWPVRIRTLGDFSVEVNGEALTFSGKVPKRLLALLKVIIAFGGKDVPEEKITDALWPDEDGDAAHQSFTTALHRLRKLLGNNDFIVQKEGQASLDPRSCWVDALAFDDLSTQAESVRAGGAESFEDVAMRAASLYSGDFLPPEIGAAWVLPIRARLREHFIYLVGSLGARLEDAHRWEDALALYRRGVEADILTETFYQGLMRCHYQGGRTAEALSVYRRMRELLHESFGLQPSTATEELFRALSSK
jgi:LuxR family maltose regulon positive regulatory protein